MREIAIQDLNNLKELDNFISDTNEKALTIKGIVVADDGDIKSISADIKELKEREDTLKIAEEKLIKLAGIDRVGIAIDNSREQRLLANKNVQNAKQEIKNKALDFFTSNADELIKNSQSSDTYKQTFNTKQMASDAISGKSKDLMGAMKTELSNLGLRLDNNARETEQKLAIMNNYANDLVRDLGYLLEMPIDTLDLELRNREIAKDNEIETKAKKLADEKIKEAGRLAKIEADKIETERLAKIEADKIETERLAKIEADKIESERLAKIEADKIETERLAKIETDRLEALAKLDEKIGADDKAKAKAEKEIVTSDFKDAKRYRHLRNIDIDLVRQKGRSMLSRYIFVLNTSTTEPYEISGKELDDAVDNEMRLKNDQ